MFTHNNHKKIRKNGRRRNGFTIIEVLIVLAIAGLIILIVFLGVPKVLRAIRDNDRKRTTSALLTQVEQYVTNNNGRLPTNPDGSVNAAALESFKTSYARDLLKGDKYSLTMLNYAGVDHSYIGQLNEIVIVAGHWCNDRPGVETNEPEGHPITGNHDNPKDVVLWTQLEAGYVFCIDNSDGVYLP